MAMRKVLPYKSRIMHWSVLNQRAKVNKNKSFDENKNEIHLELLSFDRELTFVEVFWRELNSIELFRRESTDCDS